MTENFSLKVLKILVLIYGFLLYFNLKDIDRLGSSPLLQFHVTASVCPGTNTFMLFGGLKISPGHWLEDRPPPKVTSSALVVRRMVGNYGTGKGQRTSKGLKNK